MKTANHTILLALAVAGLLIVSQQCQAAEPEQGDESAWLEGGPKLAPKLPENSDEAIDHIMRRIKETDPNKADELTKMRQSNPEKFRDEIRKIMRERLGGKMRERMGQRDTGPMVPLGPMGPLDEFEIMHDRSVEYLEWLKKNDPNEAKELTKLKAENPELFMRKVMLGYKKYGRIIEAAKENPELAKVLKENLALNAERDKLLGKIKAATNENEKKSLIKELGNVLDRKFDVILKRKQISYQQLLKKLDELKQEIKKSEANVEKWKDPAFKKESVKKHLEELIAETEGFEWN